MDFCSKCGRELTDSAIGCPNCDATVSNCDNAKDSGKKKILVGAILGAVVVVALVIVLICTLGGGGYEELVEKYINVEYYQQFTEDNIRPLAPENMWEDWVGSKDSSVDAMFARWEKNNEEYYEEYNNEYNVNIEYEIVHETELSERELYDICEEIEDYHNMDYPEFIEGYTFKLKVTGEIIGPDEIEEVNRTENMAAVKMDGEWYLVYVDKDGYCWYVDYML